MALHVLTLKRIYESVVLPRALYGSELWSNLSQNDIMLLERSHRLCIKTMQNMDRNTCVALTSLGMINLSYVIVKRKLTLFGQLCRLGISYAATKNKIKKKKLFLYRLSSHYLYENKDFGFIPDAYQLLKDYYLEYVLTDYMNSGVFLSMYTWKKLVM